ncbi:aldo/keto reductase [Brucella anthropi]|jgi:2,5-diketo-D-gluconate reductase A|uniref:Aldo/keto reductase n=1 Tax=Brucella anthropi TaxID=529 RepID=A0A011TMK5_BRUAN|nr:MULTISPECIES: aldo/keto reductase [Brucella/Ochrobactrum group]MCR5941377.1 aldo/keto reductase [Ochrobactrum sp. XJ1]QTN05396.1 aldo/keto reductase [Ochrobactrum sp. EEELCW01]EXL05302.1 2,5-diketo-D-gluconic acid reductase [Brucella anthropi]KAB2735917.1 aldo/keto reductase [Brucella anthropi]KAB2757211.1 aldo/keto reductase [Brucella anthropi]
MTVPTVKLNDGNHIPQLGYGVWQVGNDEAVAAVSEALKAGYRHIDTAAIYGNEEGVGKAIKSSGIERGDIYLTTKLWNGEQGYESTLKAFDASLKKLGTDYVDLYLIHWPMPSKDLFMETWRAFLKLKEEGRAKSIGVSNFRTADLERIITESGVTPVLNQIELHPQFQQDELRLFHSKHDIATEAWSPLGQGKILEDATLKAIAEKHGKSVAQIILRWHIETGNIVIPKSVTPARIKENFDIFDFRLNGTDHDAITKLDKADGRIGPNPSTFSAG